MVDNIPKVLGFILTGLSVTHCDTEIRLLGCCCDRSYLPRRSWWRRWPAVAGSRSGSGSFGHFHRLHLCWYVGGVGLVQFHDNLVDNRLRIKGKDAALDHFDRGSKFL